MSVPDIRLVDSCKDRTADEYIIKNATKQPPCLRQGMRCQHSLQSPAVERRDECKLEWGSFQSSTGKCKFQKTKAKEGRVWREERCRKARCAEGGA
eukprot:1026380-Rhodomonas_salina.1